jgi:hypothetical protein
MAKYIVVREVRCARMVARALRNDSAVMTRQDIPHLPEIYYLTRHRRVQQSVQREF